MSDEYQNFALLVYYLFLNEKRNEEGINEEDCNALQISLQIITTARKENANILALRK